MLLSICYVSTPLNLFNLALFFCCDLAIWTAARLSWVIHLSPSRTASASNWPRRSSRTKLSFPVRRLWFFISMFIAASRAIFVREVFESVSGCIVLSILTHFYITLCAKQTRRKRGRKCGTWSALVLASLSRSPSSTASTTGNYCDNFLFWMHLPWQRFETYNLIVLISIVFLLPLMTTQYGVGGSDPHDQEDFGGSSGDDEERSHHCGGRARGGEWWCLCFFLLFFLLCVSSFTHWVCQSVQQFVIYSC